MSGRRLPTTAKLRAPWAMGTGANWFCGPAAISAITGQPLETVLKWIHFLRGRYDRRGYAHPVTGMRTPEVLDVLRRLGWTAKDHQVPARKSQPTLAGWARARRGDDRRALWLVVLTRHFIVVQGERYTDNGAREIRPLKRYPHRRTRVRSVARIIPYDPPGGVPKLYELPPVQMPSFQDPPMELCELFRFG